MSQRRPRAGPAALSVAAVVCWAPIRLILVWIPHESAASATFPPRPQPTDLLVENARAALAAVRDTTRSAAC